MSRESTGASNAAVERTCDERLDVFSDSPVTNANPGDETVAGR